VYVWETGGFDDSNGGGYIFERREARWVVVDYLAMWIT